jgi:DNA-binding transcriptional LysR family regulator
VCPASRPASTLCQGRAVNFQRLETLVWLAKLRNFRAVARQLNTTQPSVSLRLQRLEDELGTRLLTRDQRGVALTAAGRECLAYAEQILAWLGELRARGGSPEALRGRVSLGVSEIIADTWLAELLGVIAARHPAVVVDTTVDMTPRLTGGLEDGTYDAVLVGSYRLATIYPTLSLGSTPFSWISAPGAFPSEAPLTPQELQRLPLITWPRQAAIHSRLTEWFAGHGVYPQRQHTCNSVIAMARLAAAGLGVALLPEQVVARELAEGSLSVIPTVPGFPAVEYLAIFIPGRPSLGEVVARIAAECSPFDSRRPPV